jgi:hypothetical protein
MQEQFRVRIILKLLRFEAENYRSLKSFGLDVDDFLVLVGENNHGKSNFFYALELFLSSSTKGVSKEIFFNRLVDKPIRLTATFKELSEQESQKLRPWMVNGTMTLRKEYAIDLEDKTSVDYYALMSVPVDDWLDSGYAEYNNRSVLSTLPIGSYLPATGKISKVVYAEAVRRYTEDNRSTIAYRTELRKNPAGFKQVLDGYLPELYLVPAIQDASNETNTSTSSTLLGRLIGLVIDRMSLNNPTFQQVKKSLESVKVMIDGTAPDQKIAEIRELESSIKRELLPWNVGIDIGIEAPDPKTIFTLGTRIVVDDGIATDISQKGHGLQRALLFALIRIWASTIHKPVGEERQRASIIAFEEPELFLHPQLSRVTYDALKHVSEVEQVLICSHSPHFVSLEDYRNIAIIRKLSPQEGTKAYKVQGDLFEAGSEQKKRFSMIQFFNPDRNELFFSRKVVLAEGATEKVLLPLLAKRMNIFDHRISIVDCNGKSNLSIYIKVLNSFRVPYLVIHDEDPIDPDLRPGAPKDNAQKLQEATRIFNENRVIASAIDPAIGRVHMVCPDFESLLGISNSRVEAVGKPYAAAEKYIDATVPFLNSIEEMVRLAYS